MDHYRFSIGQFEPMQQPNPEQRRRNLRNTKDPSADCAELNFRRSNKD